MAQASFQQNQVRRLRSTVSTVGPITSAVLFVGLSLILTGAALQTGVWAGMFGIIGALFIIVAVVSRVLIWVYRRL